MTNIIYNLIFSGHPNPSSVDIARRAISMDDIGFSMPNGSENPPE